MPQTAGGTGLFISSVMTRYDCRVEKTPSNVAAANTYRTGGVQTLCIGKTMWPDEVHVKLGFVYGNSSSSRRISSLQNGYSSLMRAAAAETNQGGFFLKPPAGKERYRRG